MIEIFLGAVVFLLLAFVFAVVVFIIVPLFYGASYEGSDARVVKKMVELSKAKDGEKFADLGSGDGRIVIAFAKSGIEAQGYEINPFLVLFARRRIKKLGLEKMAFIHWKNFWKVDLSNFDIVGLFQIGYLMRKIEKKLKSELRKGSRVVSNRWGFSNLKIEKQADMGTGVYLYKIR